MATGQWYVDPATGNDYKGATFTDGAFTVADMTLTKTGAFTASKANHWLYLTDNGSGNVTAGYYKVASVTSANAVVLAASPKSGATDPTDVKCTQATGASNNPFRSVQGALDLLTRNASGDTGGDQINLKAGTSDTLSAALSFTTFGSGTSTKPIYIRGYTSTANDGGIGVIDGANAYAIIASSINTTFLQDLRFTNTGANTMVVLTSGCGVIHCEFDTSARSALEMNGGPAINCYVHGVATASGYIGIKASNNSTVIGCIIDGAGMNTANQCIQLNPGSAVVNNIIYGVVSTGIYANGEGLIMGNTIVGNSGTKEGIKIPANFGGSIINNIIMGFSGAGGYGIDSAGYKVALSANNAFYNNTAQDTYTWLFNDLGDNDTLSGDPFTNAAGGDYSLNGTVSGATEDGLMKSFNYISTTSKVDKGAVQAGAGAGGGGGGPIIGSRIIQGIGVV